MADTGRDGKDLKLTAALYASRPGVVDHVRRTGRLPDDIPMGGAHIGLRLLIEQRGRDIELTTDEQLVHEAMLREGRLPGGRVLLVPDERKVFESHDRELEYPQDAVDRVLWWLRSKRSEAPASTSVQAIGQWLASNVVNHEANADGVVIPFDRLPDPSNLEDGTELSEEEALPYLAEWLGSAFRDDSSELPAYRIIELRGSDGSSCYCLYLTTGDAMSGLEVELCLLSQTVEQGLEHLRERIGVVDVDWDETPDDVVLRVLARES